MTIDDLRQLCPNALGVPNSAIELFQVRQFLDDVSCQKLVAMIEAQRRPSTITDNNGDPEFRTSETCDLFASDPFVAALDGRLAALLDVPTELGEIMQGQRYLPGQEFKPHTDRFEPSGLDYAEHCAARGSGRGRP